jgi:histidine triad (HIT) family protein
VDWLRLARSPAGRRLVGWAFAKMSFALPVRRLRETETLLAFYHPRPAYPVHILLVPKKALVGLEALGPKDGPFLADLVAAVQSLVSELKLEAAGYRLIANGGRFQDVPQLHFHLVSGPAQESSGR